MEILMNIKALFTLKFGDDQVAVVQDSLDLKIMLTKLYSGYAEVNHKKAEYLVTNSDAWLWL